MTHTAEADTDPVVAPVGGAGATTVNTGAEPVIGAGETSASGISWFQDLESGVVARSWGAMGAVGCFRVLGPLEVRHGTDVIPVRAGQQRVVLATLLLRANRTVPMEELVDKLWYGAEPVDARGAVQKYVMRLRRVLRDGGFTDDGIRTEPEGYRLELAPGQLDLDRFQELVEEGTRAAEAGDADTGRARLGEALALWRGVPPLSNVASESLHQREVPELVERYLGALERRIDADLTLGRHAELVAELAGLTRDHPLRERFWSQRMRALAGAGRKGEALETYREVARLLADELGIDPGPELQAAHQQLLRGDDHDPSTQSTQSPAGQHPLAPPPGARTRQPVRQLPAPSAVFVGRRTQLARVVDVLRVDEDAVAPPVVAVSGPPGVGKTALALRAAHLVADRFPDGQLFIDLNGYSPTAPLSTSETLGRFLNALGVDRPPLDVDEQVSVYRSLLADRRMLLVLDNASSVAQIRPLLPGTGSCAVLVTSRGELTGLAVSPGAEQVSLGALSAGEGYQLLQEVLGVGRVSSAAAAAHELVELCGGLTLALRVAAAHLGLRPGLRIDDYLSDLRSRDRVSALSVDSDDKTNLAAAFDWSYRQLTPSDQRLLRLLGLIPGRSCTVATAAAMAEVDEPQAAAGLERLAAASLLERTVRSRYRMHDLLREYAARRCELEEPAPDRQRARRRLFDHYIASADAVSRAFVRVSRLDRPPPPEPADPDRALADLDEDRAAMVAAVRHAAEHGPLDAAYHLADALRGYFTLRGHTVDWLAAVDAGLAAARAAGAEEAVAAMLNSRGALGYYTGDTQQARADLQCALELYDRLGSVTSNAVRINLGTIAHVSGDVDAAVEYLTAAIAGYHDAGDARLEQMARENLVLALLEVGDLSQARRHADPLRAVAALAGNHIALGATAMLTQRTGDLRQAATMLAQAASRAAAGGDHRTELALLAELATCRLQLGQDNTALGIAQQLLAQPDDPRNMPSALTTVAGALHQLGRPAEARSRYSQAVEAARASGNRAQECEALLGWARLELTAETSTHAAGLAAEAVRIARAATLRLQLIQALVVFAVCRRREHQFDQALSTVQQALDVAERCHYPLGRALALAELGELQLAQGDAMAAAQNWERAAEIFTEIGSRHAVEVERRRASAVAAATGRV